MSVFFLSDTEPTNCCRKTVHISYECCAPFGVETCKYYEPSPNADVLNRIYICRWKAYNGDVCKCSEAVKNCWKEVVL